MARRGCSPCARRCSEVQRGLGTQISEQSGQLRAPVGTCGLGQQCREALPGLRRRCVGESEHIQQLESGQSSWGWTADGGDKALC